MTTEAIITSNNMPSTPGIRLRGDGRYLAYSRAGQPIMIGVYGVSEEDAISKYKNRLSAWEKSIADSKNRVR